MKQINTMSMKLLSAIILLLVGFSANAQLNRYLYRLWCGGKLC